jgi:hypothetical protein
VDGRTCALYEGDLTDYAAFGLLQGPFQELVARGTLGFSNVGGVGRVYVEDGALRRVAVSANGKYAYYSDTDNMMRRGLASIEMRVDVSGIGRAKVEPPRDAARILERTSD